MNDKIIAEICGIGLPNPYPATEIKKGIEKAMEKIQTIYKYPINSGEPITAPFVKILDIQYQGDDLYMWAIVEPESESTMTVVPTIVGTGYSLKSFSTLGKYFKTVQDGPYPYVWHVFLSCPNHLVSEPSFFSW